MKLRIAVTIVAVAALVSLAGCQATQLPTYEEVRTETEAAMQRIVDELPEGSTVEDLTNDTPFACNEGSSAVFFTGHWAVITPDGFDRVGFVEGLPDVLGPGFEQRESQIDTGPGSVKLRTTGEDDVHLSATAVEDGQVQAVDILAMSRCAQEPPAAE